MNSSEDLLLKIVIAEINKNSFNKKFDNCPDEVLNSYINISNQSISELTELFIESLNISSVGAGILYSNIFSKNEEVNEKILQIRSKTESWINLEDKEKLIKSLFSEGRTYEALMYKNIEKSVNYIEGLPYIICNDVAELIESLNNSGDYFDYVGLLKSVLEIKVKFESFQHISNFIPICDISRELIISADESFKNIIKSLTFGDKKYNNFITSIICGSKVSFIEANKSLTRKNSNIIQL